RANVGVPVSPKCGRYQRSVRPVVPEFCRNENAVGLSVVLEVGNVDLAVRKAVVRVELRPLAIGSPVVNVIAVCIHVAAHQVRSFAQESRVGPVVVKGHGFTYLHGTYKLTRTVVGGGTGTNYPVAHLRNPSEYRLTSREGASAVKWIRCEPVIAGDDV